MPSAIPGANNSISELAIVRINAAAPTWVRHLAILFTSGMAAQGVAAPTSVEVASRWKLCHRTTWTSAAHSTTLDIKRRDPKNMADLSQAGQASARPNWAVSFCWRYGLTNGISKHKLSAKNICQSTLHQTLPYSRRSSGIPALCHLKEDGSISDGWCNLDIVHLKWTACTY